MSATQYYQATLFHAEHITMLRSLPISSKLQAGQRMHDVAKLLMDKALSIHNEHQSAEKRDHLHRAQQEYEAAYGLFVYMTPLSDEWRQHGVRDEYVSYCDTVGVRTAPRSAARSTPTAGGATTTVEQQQPSEADDDNNDEALDFVVKTLCHLSICLRHNATLRDVSLEALQEANRRDPWNLRAAFLLAKQLQQRPNSTSTELQIAVKALGVALDDAEKRRPTTANIPEDHITSATQLRAELEEELRRVMLSQKKTIQKFLESRPSNDKGDSCDGDEKDTAFDRNEHPSDSRAHHMPSSSKKTTSSGGPKHVQFVESGESRVHEEEGGSHPPPMLKGNWFEQAEQARHAIARMDHEGQRKEAAALQRQLNEAAAEKLFVEYMVPRKCFDVNALSSELQAQALCDQLHISLSDPHIIGVLEEKMETHFTQTVPMHLMPILDVELMLFSLGLISTTDLNDLDAKHRHNAYFVSKTEGRGLVSPKPLLAGMDDAAVELRSRQLRTMLMQHLLSKQQ